MQNVSSVSPLTIEIAKMVNCPTMTKNTRPKTCTDALIIVDTAVSLFLLIAPKHGQPYNIDGKANINEGIKYFKIVEDIKYSSPNTKGTTKSPNSKISIHPMKIKGI